MICSINEIEHILPYTEMKLDCFQNLIITILNYYNVNIDFLGATWPWLFEKDYVNKEVAIVNKIICNNERMKTLYNISLVQKTFDLNITADIRKIVADMPIIVNLDHYYVPHHYPHIFNKQHGRHSLLLLNFDQKQGVFCLDTMPEYKGFIDCESLAMGIKSFPYKFGYLKYCWLESEKINYKSDQETLFIYFSQLLKATYEINNLSSHKSDLGLKNILNIVKEMDEDGEIKLNESLDRLLQGTWIWEVNRSPNWLIKYLKTDYVTKMLGTNNIEATTERIADVNNKVALAFKVLYKYLVSKRISDFVKGKQLLINAQREENELLQYLIELVKI